MGKSSLSRVAARPGLGTPFRYRVARQLAQLRVADGGQRVALPCARVMESGQLTVGGPPDIELDVLRSGFQGPRVRLDGPGARAVRRNGRHS